MFNFFIYKNIINYIYIFDMGIGDWGLGIWVFGFGVWGRRAKPTTQKQKTHNQNPKKIIFFILKKKK